MAKRMTDERLETISRCLKFTTDGPWDVVGPFVQTPYGWKTDVNSHCYAVISRDGESVADVVTNNSATLSKGDADFIANAREAVPELLMEIRRLRNENEREVDEFNAGFKAYRQRKKDTDKPEGLQFDVWGVGYAWAAYEPMKTELARLRKVAYEASRQAGKHRGLTDALRELGKYRGLIDALRELGKVGK